MYLKAQIVKWDEYRDDEYKLSQFTREEREEGWRTWTNAQFTHFEQLGREITDHIQALETRSIAQIVRNFDDWSVQRGCEKTTVFNLDGSISEVVRFAANGEILAKKDTSFRKNGDIFESVSFFTNGDLSFNVTKCTIFNPDGSIKEVI
jgi:hypothetical protein